MVEGRVKPRSVATLVPQAGQLGIGAISYAAQHFQRKRPVLCLRAQLPRKIEDVVVGGGVTVAKSKCDNFAGGPACAAVIDVNVLSRWRAHDPAQSPRNESWGRGPQRLEKLGSGVIVERTGSPSTHGGRM